MCLSARGSGAAARAHDHLVLLVNTHGRTRRHGIARNAGVARRFWPVSATLREGSSQRAGSHLIPQGVDEPQRDERQDGSGTQNPHRPLFLFLADLCQLALDPAAQTRAVRTYIELGNNQEYKELRRQFLYACATT